MVKVYGLIQTQLEILFFKLQKCVTLTFNI